jgi:hypothetical protein
MSESKDKGWLYDFLVKKTIEKKETEVIKNDKGEETETTKTTKEEVAVTFKLKKPNRRLYEDADLFYGIKLSEGIKAGLLTKSLLAKRYSNDGGFLSEPEKDKYAQLYMTLFEQENELQRLQINLEEKTGKERSEKVREITVKMLQTRRELQEFELAQQSLFDQTAEVRAKNQSIMWWLLSLSYFEEDEKDLPVFGEGDYEDKLSKYDEYEDIDDSFWNEAVKKLAFFISFWESGQAANREDFDEIAIKLEPPKEEGEEKEAHEEELKTAYEKAEEQEQAEEQKQAEDKEAKLKAKPKAKRKKKAPEKEKTVAA